MERDGLIWRAAACVIVAIFITLLAAFVINDAPMDEEPDPHILSLNTTNTAEMHEYGLPTKTDVLEWHVHGKWAYKADGHFYVFADLPGGKSVWDELYSIEPNPVFVK